VKSISQLSFFPSTMYLDRASKKYGLITIFFSSNLNISNQCLSSICRLINGSKIHGVLLSEIGRFDLCPMVIHMIYCFRPKIVVAVVFVPVKLCLARLLENISNICISK
jgi:hypothetical protein